MALYTSVHIANIADGVLLAESDFSDEMRVGFTDCVVRFKRTFGLGTYLWNDEMILRNLEAVCAASYTKQGIERDGFIIAARALACAFGAIYEGSSTKISPA